MTRELQDKAQAHIQQNEWEQAINCLKEAQAVEAENPYILGPLGFCYSRVRQHEQAITIYEHLNQLQPEEARWLYMLGYQYYDQQQYDQAVNYFNQALAINPHYIVVLYRKGYALSTMGTSKRGEALTTLERCRDAFKALPDGEAKDRERKHYGDACYQQGKLFLEAGNYRLAQERLQEALTFKPKEGDVYYALGKCYLENGQFDEAIPTLSEAMRLSDKPQHYIIDRLMQAHAGAGQFAEAIRDYEQAPPFIRSRPYILRHAGQIYLDLEQWDKAEQSLREAVKKERHNHNGHYYLGLVYRQQEKWELAAKAFKEAVTLRQKNYNLPFQEAEGALQALLAEHPEIKRETAEKPTRKLPISRSGRPIGRVKKFFADRGFGFLEVTDSEEDLFFHIKQVKGRDVVNEGEYLEYDIGEGRKGLEAKNLQVVSGDNE